MKDRRYLVLLIGDALVLILITLAGFARHSTLDSAGIRILATFIPLCLAWLVVGTHLKAFDLNRSADIRQIWRPVWAMVLAAPLFAWLRSLWLNSPILPSFVTVMASVSALGLFMWRLIFWKFFSQEM